MSVVTSRVSVELNKVWAKENPELFTKKMFEFGENYPSGEWNHKIDFTRDGFIYVTAIIKDN